MLIRPFAIGALAMAALALTSSARAEDTIRLSLPGSPDATTRNLKATQADLRSDTLAMARGRGGAARGGRAVASRSRGVAVRSTRGVAVRSTRGVAVRSTRGVAYRGGRAVAYRGGRGVAYRGGYYGGYRGYRGAYYGGYRGYVYPRYNYGGLYYPSYYGYYPRYYYPRVYYSYPIYSYPAYSYYYPTALTTGIPRMPLATSSQNILPAPSTTDQPTTPGTFPYDGGPRAPLPVPDGEETRIQQPQRPALVNDLVVSAKTPGGKWHYPAYGEKPTRSPLYPIQPAVIAGNIR